MSSRLPLTAPPRPGDATATTPTRTRILEAATTLLRAHDGQRVSMAAIAAEAGVSRQALYLHFTDRADLLVATVDHIDASGPLAEQSRRVEAAPDSVTALDRFVELHADYSPHIIEVARTIDAGRLTDSDLAAAWEDRQRGRRRACGRRVDALHEAGRLAPRWTTERATDFLWAQTSLRVWDDLVTTRGWSRDEFVDAIQTTLHATLVTGA